MEAHDYMMLNVGNEFVVYNVDDPAYPTLSAESGFEFGTAGDSDYDMLNFDVCDDCCYGTFVNKVTGTVIFDFGGGATPSFQVTRNTRARWWRNGFQPRGPGVYRHCDNVVLRE